MPNTPNNNLPFPISSDPDNVPADVQALAESLDNTAYIYSGTIAQRPVSTVGEPGKRGRFWWATDISVLSFDFGTSWIDIYPTGAAKAGSITRAMLAADAKTPETFTHFPTGVDGMVVYLNGSGVYPEGMYRYRSTSVTNFPKGWYPISPLVAVFGQTNYVGKGFSGTRWAGRVRVSAPLVDATGNNGDVSGTSNVLARRDWKTGVGAGYTVSFVPPPGMYTMEAGGSAFLTSGTRVEVSIRLQYAGSDYMTSSFVDTPATAGQWGYTALKADHFEIPWTTGTPGTCNVQTALNDLSATNAFFSGGLRSAFFESTPQVFYTDASHNARTS